MNDEITRLLAPLLLRPLTPVQRRKLAALFEGLAATQRELADADERTGHVVRRARIAQQASRQRTGRPRGSGARFVRLEAPSGHQISWRLHIGRALYQEIGEPQRFDIQRYDGVVRLRPAAGDEGYSVSQTLGGMPRFSLGATAVEALRLEAGRYTVEIRAGELVVGERLL